LGKRTGPIAIERLIPILLLCRIGFAQYAGSGACRACHPSQFAAQLKSDHAHALALAPKGSPGHWAFGAGAKAITYVSQADPDFYLEHGLSYYASTKAMAPTPGHPNGSDMRYRTFDPVASVLRCFRCHSTGPLRLGAGYSIEPFEPGVHCESCHGPGGAHVSSGGAPQTIQNPKRLGAVELNLFCGTCHRKPPEAGEESDWSNAWNTRHEPDYLSHAACFRKSNGALSCTTCHSPHARLNHSATEYDKRCSTCHQMVRHRSAVASRSCVGCHMPQVTVTTQLRFTNHWIGIYEKGAELVPKRRTARGLLPLRLILPASSGFPSPADPASLKPLFERALADRERELGEKHTKVARSASDLGLFLRNLGDPAAAEAPLRKALEIDKASADPQQWADCENLALTLGAQGKRQEAFDLFRSAAQGQDPAVAARSLAALAALDSTNAEAYYRLALQNEEKASGRDHPRVAILLNDLGLALRQREDNKSAEPLFRRALAIQEKALGPNHAATAATLNNLGSLLQSTGQLAEAERSERRALRIFEEKLGPESMELATACSNMADLLWTKGDRVSAAALYRRAVSIDESVYGPEDPEVAGDLANLGMLLKESGQSAAAQGYLRRALAIYEKALGPDSPRAVDVRKSLDTAVTPR
jgi:tetratricopeptide (TPR) repeat protein